MTCLDLATSQTDIDGRSANALLQVISAERPKLAAALSILSQNPPHSSKVSLLSAVLHTTDRNFPTQDVDGNVVAVMDTRLSALLALQHADAADTLDTASTTSDARVPAEILQLPPGWRKLSERDGWRPAPIGVYVTCP